ncbi:hypothetical protein ABZZ17_05495 [Streptomyces sp. NPDC006512]|uniref:hypothetical protein n=1 Tax=Streptomyces sp. NPDC006512 TaxID=3154307 RepID=UPI0033B94363
MPEPTEEMDAYHRRMAEMEQMHADYEAMDQAEYDAFNDEMDARDAAWEKGQR